MNKADKAKQEAIKDMRKEGLNVSVLQLDTTTKNSK
jgi:hypothetical protein